ncbi:hypothetical protein OIU76_030063 [Salix suchowensis]|nr:hypothetical protein OIU76_030063 [Salix suchowensis]
MYFRILHSLFFFLHPHSFSFLHHSIHLHLVYHIRTLIFSPPLHPPSPCYQYSQLLPIPLSLQLPAPPLSLLPDSMSRSLIPLPRQQRPLFQSPFHCFQHSHFHSHPHSSPQQPNLYFPLLSRQPLAVPQSLHSPL